MDTHKSTDTLGELLRCFLCRAELVSQNRPKSLPCLHTFCTPCLAQKQELFMQKGTNRRVCPLCHAAFNADVKDLKLDNITEKLLGIHLFQQNEQHYCGMCTDERVFATRWCQDCLAFLCDTCLVHHGRYKPEDKVIDVSREVDAVKVSRFISPTKCIQHGKEFTMYCPQCEVCLCLACVPEHQRGPQRTHPFNERQPLPWQVADLSFISNYTVTPSYYPASFGGRSCCPILIGNISSDTKFKGQKLLENSRTLIEREKAQIKRIEFQLENFKKQSWKKCGEICDHVDETCRRLRESAFKLIKEVEETTASRIDEFEKMISRRQDNINNTEILNKNFQQVLQKFDDTDIMFNFSRFKTKYNNLENNDVIIDLQDINIEYDCWYMDVYEMSQNQPLGRVTHCQENLGPFHINSMTRLEWKHY